MIKVNLSSENIASELAMLDRENLVSFQKTLRKILKMTWSQVYKDKGIRWEEITASPKIEIRGQKLKQYSIRLSRRFRAVVCRIEDEIVFVSLHPDHDSAYS